MYRASYCNMEMNQQNAQILVTSLCAFVGGIKKNKK